MQVHLVDGTYELFRHYFAVPSRLDAGGREVGALVGVLRSVLAMIRDGATHLGVATDHAVESFRNDLYSGYKTGEGLEPALWAQFHPLEEALRGMGVVVWPMVEQEADDALAAAAARAAEDRRVDRVLVCSPDKDLSQCVRADRVVQFDRRKRELRDEEGVWLKFGVAPTSIPDWLALVGDSADGFPGLAGWGAKSAASVIGEYGHLEDIPEDPDDWAGAPRGSARLSKVLREGWNDALLFRDLATLRTDAEVLRNVDELRWKGPAKTFAAECERLGVPDLARTAAGLASA